MAGLRGVSVSEIPMEEANALMEEQMKRPAPRASVKGVGAREIPMTEANKLAGAPGGQAPRAAGMGGATATEIPRTEWASARNAASGNPNFARGGPSPQATAWQDELAKTAGSATAEAAKAPANSALYRGARHLGHAVGKVAPVVGNGMAIYSGVRSARAMDRGDYAAGLGHGLDAVMGTTALPIAAAYGAGRLVGGQVYDRVIAPDQELSDKIGGTINQGVRGVGKFFGQDWGVDDSAYLQQRATERLARPQSQPRPGSTQAVQPVGARVERAAGIAAEPYTDVPAGWTSRNVPGASGVRRMTTGDGRTLYTNVAGDDNAALMNGRGGTVSTVPGMPQDQIDAALARRDAAVDDAPMQTSALVIGQRGARMEDDLRAKTDAYTPNWRDRPRTAKERQGLREDLMRRDAAGADLAGRMAIAQEQNAITARGQDMNAETAAAARLSNERMGLREIDSRERVAAVGARSAAAKARYDMLKDERDFQAGRADKNFEQREAADKNVLARLEAMNPGEDGKPDMQAVASQKQYLDRGLADLGLEGYHQLAPQSQQQLLAATGLLTRIQRDGGFAMWKPDVLATVSPADLIGMEYDKGSDSYLITRAKSRALGQSIPARYFKREDAGYFFGTPTNQYDNLIRGARDDQRQ